MDLNGIAKLDLVDMIINQANSLNKKIKSFKADNIVEHFNMVQNYLGDDVKYKKDVGSITKGTKFYGKKSMLELKRIFVTLHTLNNHDIYGTKNKYNKYKTDSWEMLQTTVRTILENKGYDEPYVTKALTSKDFWDKIYVAFADKEKYKESDEIIESVYLDYKDNGITQDEKERIVNNIEHGINTADEILETNQLFNEFLRSGGNLR